MNRDSALPALYHPHTKKWLISKNRGTGFTFRQLGEEDIVLSATRTVWETPWRASIKSKRQKLEQRIVQDVPELAPGLDFLADLAEESSIVNASVEANDSSVGQLFALGAAASATQEMTDVGAYAFGQDGSALGVGKLGKGRRRILPREEVVIFPELFARDEEIVQFPSPIKQLVFARHVVEERWTSHLAVRTSVGSTISNVRWRRNPYKDQSMFSCDTIYTVENRDTGGFAHSDLSFNPFHEKQFGIIDENYSWSIWDYEAKRSTDFKTSRPYLRGRMPESMRRYGWGKLIWGHDASTIMATSRSHVCPFDLRSPQQPVSFLSLSDTREKPWVMDLKKIPNEKYHTLLLTSSSLIWLDMRQPGKFLRTTQHFRQTQDTTLRMELLRSRDVTNTFIYSRRNPAITTIQLSLLEGIQPSFLDCPSSLPINRGARPITLTSFPMEISQGKKTKEEYISLYYTSTDLSIRRQMYATGSDTELKPRIRRHFIGQDHRFLSSTVVTDSDVEEEKKGIAIQEQDPRIKNIMTMLGVDKHKPYGTWSYRDVKEQKSKRHEMSVLYEAAFAKGSLKTAEQGLQGLLSALRIELEDMMKLQSPDYKKIVSLFEICQPKTLFNDLELMGKELNQLYIALVPEENRRLLLIPQEFPFRVWSEENRNGIPYGGIQAIYNRLIETYLTPLPQNINAKVRLGRERLIRTVSIDGWLASIGVELKPRITKSKGEKEQAVIETGGGESMLPASQTVTPIFQSPANSNPGDKELSGLNKYTSVGMHSLSTGIQNLLSGWKIGKDPQEYEWIPINPDDQDEVARTRRTKSASVPILSSQFAAYTQPEKVNVQVSSNSQHAEPVPKGFGSGGEENSHSDQSVENWLMSQPVSGRFGGGERGPIRKRKLGF